MSNEPVTTERWLASSNAANVILFIARRILRNTFYLTTYLKCVLTTEHQVSCSTLYLKLGSSLWTMNKHYRGNCRRSRTELPWDPPWIQSTFWDRDAREWYSDHATIPITFILLGSTDYGWSSNSGRGDFAELSSSQIGSIVEG
jgi:hypothetical protein